MGFPPSSFEGNHWSLQVLAVIVEQGQRTSHISRVFQPLPQTMRNVRFEGGAPLESKVVQAE